MQCMHITEIKLGHIGRRSVGPNYLDEEVSMFNSEFSLCPCVRVRQGFRGFLGQCEKVFSLTTIFRGGLPLQVEFFYSSANQSLLLDLTFRLSYLCVLCGSLEEDRRLD